MQWHNNCIKINTQNSKQCQEVVTIIKPEVPDVVRNQSNQGFGQTANRGKSYHGEQTGGKPSVPQKKTTDQSSNRNTSVDREES